MCTGHGRLAEYNGAGYDADLVVLFKPYGDFFCGPSSSLLASAGALLQNDVTGRPVVGQVLYCNVVVDDFEYDLAVFVHELLHILVSLSSACPCIHRHLPGHGERSMHMCSRCSRWPWRVDHVAAAARSPGAVPGRHCACIWCP